MLLRGGRSLFQQSLRWLNLQEYQSKGLLREAGVTVQDFVVAGSTAEARDKLGSFKPAELVVKAQVLAGGRGKGKLSSGLQGGVQLTKDPKQALDYVDQMIGHKIVTKQTPADGVEVGKVMIAESVDLVRETYLAILLDRESQGPVIVASPAGGMDIEEVAATQPSLIFKEPVDIEKGLSQAQALTIAANLQFKGDLQAAAAEEIMKLYKLFLDVDATQIEINPLSETGCRRVFAVDAKLNFDDSARFRQRRIFAMDEGTESDPREAAAEAHGLNFVAMDGDIGCLVNGAGLAMATMDIIKLHGGEPANFLDVGGGVGEAQVTEAFKIICSDPKVKAILVNVFAGIIDCATIANGIVAALRNSPLAVPLVVRLDGNNAEAAQEILNSSGLPLTTAHELDDAARKAVAASR